MSADDVAKEAFKVPFFHKAAILLLTLLVLICGMYISVSVSDWTWLGRFGALIVIASLVLEATGLIDRYLSKIFNIVTEIMPEIVEMQVKRLPHLYGLTGNETPEQIKEIAQKEFKRRITDTKALAEKAISRDMRKLEFLVASIGTLIWAFADLLNKI